MLHDCMIQNNKRSGEFEVVANERTRIQNSPRKIAIDKSLVQSQACMEASTIKEMLLLAPSSVVSVIGKVKPPEKFR